MAVEHEIDRMVVRLIGDQSSYQKMLKDMERDSEKSVKFAEEQGTKIHNAFTKAWSSAQGMTSNIGTGLMKGGGMMAGAGGIVSGPMNAAANDFSDYGSGIQKMIRESQKLAKEMEFLKKGTVEGTEAWKEYNRQIELTEETAAVFQLMAKRTGTDIETLTKTIAVGSEEFEKWRAEAEAMGQLLTPEQVQQAVKMGEAWSRVSDSISGLWNQIGSAAADRLTKLADTITGIVQGVTEWVMNNHELIETVGDIAAKVALIGTGIAAVGTTIASIASVATPFVAAITAGAGAWGIYTMAQGRGIGEEGQRLWEEYGGTVTNATNAIMSKLQEVARFAGDTLSSIMDSLAAGDLENAVEIAWNSIKLSWITGLEELNTLTGNTFDSILTAMMAGDWETAAEEVWDALEEGFDAAAEFIKETWDDLVQYITDKGQFILPYLEAAKAFSENLGEGIDTATNLAKPGVALAGAPVRAATAPAGLLGRGLRGIAGSGVGNILTAPGRALMKPFGMINSMFGSGGAAQPSKPKSGIRRRRSPEDAALDAAESAADQIASSSSESTQELEEQKSAVQELLETLREEIRLGREKAEQAREAAEAKRTEAQEAAKLAEETRRQQQEMLAIEQARRPVEERWDPVQRYIRQLTELNALYDAGERESEAYRRELNKLQEDLADAEFAIQEDVGNVGGTAIRAGTSQDVALMQASLAELDRTRLKEKAVGEAEGIMGAREAKMNASDAGVVQAVEDSQKEHKQSLANIDENTRRAAELAEERRQDSEMMEELNLMVEI